jgi:hypothetical protein
MSSTVSDKNITDLILEINSLKQENALFRAVVPNIVDYCADLKLLKGRIKELTKQTEDMAVRLARVENVINYDIERLFQRVQALEQQKESSKPPASIYA